MRDEKQHSAHLGPAAALALLVLLTLAACQHAAPPKATPVPEPPAALPDRQASMLLRPDTGGVLGLRDGAQLSLPPQSVTTSTMVSLRVADTPPAAALPRSIVGQAYEISFDGGVLTGVGLVTLPLPAHLTPEQYDLAPYRWNGRTWERLAGRLTEGGVRFGMDKPAVFALLGEWREADATLTLALAPRDPEKATISFVLTGQYQYSSPPLVQHDYTQARLTLKRDSSGGAGQISGDETLDETVAETVLWFNPDPAGTAGVIDFNYTFEVAPEQIDVPLGSAARLYVVLTVSDSAAPTRRLSDGADYVQTLGIRVDGSEVVGSDLPQSGGLALRWNVRLNGETLFVRPVTVLRLSLAEILALGGLGEYKIQVEMEEGGQYVPVSNEVTVQLALPVTPTPVVVAEDALQPAGTSTPDTGRGKYSPFGTMPPTPTRRSRPRDPALTATAEMTPTDVAATATPTATLPAWAGIFWAESYNLAPGACTKLHWKLEGIRSITLNGAPTVGVKDDNLVCPATTTTYTLRAVNTDDTTQDYHVTIVVTHANAPGAVTFAADAYMLLKGQCTNLYWHVTGVTAVTLDGKGVAGEGAQAQQSVCPTATHTYVLRADSSSGSTNYNLTVLILPATAVPMRLWAEQYALPLNGCTAIHWSVQNVKAVYLTAGAAETGVDGADGYRDHICPSGTTPYVAMLRVIAQDDHEARRKIQLQAAPGGLLPGEVIAQAYVRQVDWVVDLEPDAAGDQGGWHILLDGVNPLFKSPGNCCQSTVTLSVFQQQVTDPYSTTMDWPINPQQKVEFRANCGTSDSTCKLDAQYPNYYLKLASP